MNRNTFLDIDDTILTKTLTLPENARSIEDDEIAKQFDSNAFFIIQPTPGACIKTKTDSGEKVFLNICTSDKIPPPEDITDAELLHILSEETPSFVIPMSIGNERLEPDKGGTPCATYDIVINTAYFEKCQKKKHFWLFTISVVMDGVSNKFNKILDTGPYTILKNKKVTGTLQQHRIANREVRKPQARKALIEEISSPTENAPKKTEPEIGSPEQTRADMTDKLEFRYVLLRQPARGAAERLIALFGMPKGVTSKDVAVHLNSERVVATVDKAEVTHDISLPHCVQVETAKGYLDKDLRILRLDMKVENAENKDEIE